MALVTVSPGALAVLERMRDWGQRGDAAGKTRLREYAEHFCSMRAQVPSAFAFETYEMEQIEYLLGQLIDWRDVQGTLDEGIEIVIEHAVGLVESAEVYREDPWLGMLHCDYVGDDQGNVRRGELYVVWPAEE